MSMMYTMRQLLAIEPYVLAPEIYDCISARCVEACGFKATILSSAELANSYGLPDLGLLTQTDVVEATARICKFSKIPMIVDAEEGDNFPVNTDKELPVAFPLMFLFEAEFSENDILYASHRLQSKVGQYKETQSQEEIADELGINLEDFGLK